MEVNEFTNSRFLIDINNYKIEKKLEKVGLGTVYYVKDKETDQMYAAKVINCKYEEKKNQIVIEREISIMMRLQHPTLIKFNGFSLKDFHEKNDITILMNYCKNGSLSEFLHQAENDKSVLNNTIREILMIGISRGMMILHKHHVIHRDLKTQNILLDQSMHPHITDYCFAKIFDITGEILGETESKCAWYYIAPEVISTRKYTGKSDVYSFGIIMYEILTGCVPYPDLENGKLTTQIFGQKVVNEDYRPEFTVPVKKQFKELIERCWSKNPEKRPTFSEIFQRLCSYFESSIYNPNENASTTGTDVNINDFCLDNVDVFEVRSYIDSITEDTSAILIEELTRKVEIIFLNNDQLMKDNKTLKRENLMLKKENEEIRDRLKRLEEIHNIKNESNQPQQQIQQKPLNEQQKLSKNENTNSSIKTSESLINNAFDKKVNKTIKALLDKEITIQFFNSLPGKSQQVIIEDLAKDGKQDQTGLYFTALNNLLKFLLQYDESNKETAFVEISPIPDEEYLVRTKILSNATNILQQNQTLDSANFVALLKQIKEVSIEIKYPSKSFKKIYNHVHHIMRTEIPELKIALFISGIHHTDITFASNKHINSIRLDSTVTTISGGSMNGSFSFCTSLTEVIIPSSVTSIGDCAFLGCTLLTDIEIPSSVTSIGFRAFEGCSSLSHLNIPSSVKSIGWRAFKECISLSEIVVPTSVKTIGEDAFPINVKVLRKSIK